MTLDFRSSERRVGRRCGRAEVSMTVVDGVGNRVDVVGNEVDGEGDGGLRDDVARG